MTPPARTQAAIELLDAIIDAARAKGAPADRLIADYFRTRRYAGSKDRRAVRELVYRAIRLCGPVPARGRAAMHALSIADPDLAPLFDGSPHGPEPLVVDELPAPTGIAPKWLVERLAKSGIARDEAKALLERAPLDLRVNSLKASRDTIELPEQGSPLSTPQGLRMPTGLPVENWPAYRDGLIEVQDLGSQWACEAVAPQAGETIVDLCAGAGGKTLALAAATGNEAQIIAADTDARRLGNLRPRAQKAGAQIAETILLNPGKEAEGLSTLSGKADRVLIDAPCSGTGTWRRNPESRWRLDPAELKRLTKLQDHVLDTGAALVRPGGRLIYVTCSLLNEEGANRFDSFLSRHEGWQAEPVPIAPGTPRGMGVRLTPYRDGTDGFFIAIARAPC
ncbi:MAG: RsmB/NOP family class I SAM-dependent RNA methyltransferase [Erythrobacter sp.]